MVSQHIKTMKVGIVTFLRSCNYGAILQCYALNKTLTELGGESICVDYWPEYFRKRYYADKVPFQGFKKDKFDEWKRKRGLKKIKDVRNKKFEKFISKNITTTPFTAHTADEITKNDIGIRKWITGSDQVWNNKCAFFDPVFFLDIPLPEGSRKYSYAASFGFKEIPEGMDDEYKRRLKGFARYSVREESGAEILNTLINEEASVHCDPTLLLTREQWEKIASSPRKDDYILIYHVTPPDWLLKQAVKLREKTGMKIVLLSPYFAYNAVLGTTVKKFGYEPAMTSSPEDFVSLFKNAKYVITNSFHGTVFSLIFHKEFWSQLKFVDGRENTRARNLLNKVGITGRNVWSQTDLQDTPINWDKVDVVLEEIRKEGKEYLSTILND